MTNAPEGPRPPKSALDISGLVDEVRRRVEEKKAQGLYDPREVRKVEMAAVGLGQDKEAAAAAEMTTRLAALGKLWVATDWGVTTHRKGLAGRVIIALKRLIYRLTKPLASVWLAQQVRFNNELLKLLETMVPGHIDARHRLAHDELRLSGVEEELATSRVRIARVLEKLEAALGREDMRGARELVGQLEEELAGAWYLAFEHIHRRPEALEARYRMYVDMIKPAAGEKLVVDVGCGRGELMEMLREEGLNVVGVELNPQAVEACRIKGLKVHHGDAEAFLAGLEEDSVGAVVMLQVVEHLGARKLLRLLTTAVSRLAPGGMLLAETINPACLSTLAGPFYLDITHRNPIHPQALKGLWQWLGLRDVEVLWLAPYPEKYRLEELEEGSAQAGVHNRNIRKLNDLLFSFQDYAVAGRK